MQTALRPRLRWGLALLLAALVALAVAVRWSHVTALPYDFHAARQYHSAQLARSYYLLNWASAPEWEKDVARVRLEEDAPLELPVFQFVTAFSYELAGGEHLWIPRSLSTVFWLVGGLFLFLLVLRFAPVWAAVGAVLVYLFLPFPLVASTSFQPDPLMVMLTLATLLAVLRHHERPTTGRLAGATALAAATVLVKPGIAAFFLFPVFAALAVVRLGARGAVTSRSFYAFSVLGVLPAAGLYVYSTVTGEFVAGRISGSINPGLLLDGLFWRGWLDSISAVLRPPFFGERLALVVLALAASGVVLARTRTQRAALVGLWGGYAAFGLTVTNYVSTHDYYSLPLVPIAALSLAAAAGGIAGRLGRAPGRRTLQAAGVALFLAVVAVGLGGAESLSPARPDPENERRVEVYEDVGELVGHTTRALVLGGTGLWHHARIAGRYWPEQDDLEWETTLDGLRPMSAEERFVTTDTRYYPAVGTMQPPPSVFVVAEPIELALQPDLSVFLSDYPLLAETPDYLIFDLERPAEPPAADPADAAPRGDPTPETSSFYRFPAAWGGVARGMTASHVRAVLGPPARVEKRDDLRKAFEAWFYEPDGRYALVFVDGVVFARAHERG